MSSLPNNGLPIEAIMLIALFIESVFYGLYLVTFGISIRVLAFTKSFCQRRICLLTVVLLLFVVATLNIAFSLRHVLDAFVWYTGPGGARAQLYDISNRVNAIKTVNYVVQTIIGDGMLLYRLYAVYSHDWRIVAFPALLWATTIGLGAVTCQITFSLDQDATLNSKRLVPFVTSALGVTMALNVVATSLILLKLWVLQRRSSKVVVAPAHDSQGSVLRRLTHVLIESAAMYTTAVFIFFVVYACSNDGYYAITDSIVQIIGIAFNFIIVRTYQGGMAESTEVAPLTSHITMPSPTNVTFIESCYEPRRHGEKDSYGDH
ncbi:hypothetical protein FA95DRAFT_1604415 [Auriscalpium vulgare]|uniref:Uncharacterized protein n=1 Tax=Auriscalpium vulgare TaxID=40419 RepID=A0ACB8S013_9AGAM|nr:hypothetical protein FA95DRAFT_1604415 [Auriscalpium vulgare]